MPSRSRWRCRTARVKRNGAVLDFKKGKNDKDLDVSPWFAVFVPAKTAKPVIDRLHAEITKALKLPDIQERFATIGAEGIGSIPDQLAAHLNVRPTAGRDHPRTQHQGIDPERIDADLREPNVECLAAARAVQWLDPDLARLAREPVRLVTLDSGIACSWR